jgi:hypothetical protein
MNGTPFRVLLSALLMSSVLPSEGSQYYCLVEAGPAQPFLENLSIDDPCYEREMGRRSITIDFLMELAPTPDPLVDGVVNVAAAPPPTITFRGYTELYPHKDSNSLTVVGTAQTHLWFTSSNNCGGIWTAAITDEVHQNVTPPGYTTEDLGGSSGSAFGCNAKAIAITTATRLAYSFAPPKTYVPSTWNSTHTGVKSGVTWKSSSSSSTTWIYSRATLNVVCEAIFPGGGTCSGGFALS